MIRTIISPISVSTFFAVLTCTAIMMYSGINMAPAIAFNGLYLLASQTSPAVSVRKLAMSIFNPAPWQPYRVSFSISATITLVAAFYTFCLHISSRLLMVMMTLTRARTAEQNFASILSKWNAYSFFFVSDSFAETFSAVTVLCCMIWATHTGVRLVINDSKRQDWDARIRPIPKINISNGQRGVPVGRVVRNREPVGEKTFAEILKHVQRPLPTFNVDLEYQNARAETLAQIQALRQAAAEGQVPIPAPNPKNHLNCANRRALCRQEQRQQQHRDDEEIAQDFATALELVSQMQELYKVIEAQQNEKNEEQQENQDAEENEQTKEEELTQDQLQDMYNAIANQQKEETRMKVDQTVPVCCPPTELPVSVAEQLPHGFMDENRNVQEKKENQNEENVENNVATVEDVEESN